MGHTHDLMLAVRQNLMYARTWNGEWPCPIAVDKIEEALMGLERVLEIVEERKKLAEDRAAKIAAE